MAETKTLPAISAANMTNAFRDRLDVMLFPLGLILFVLLITAEWLLRTFSNLS